MTNGRVRVCKGVFKDSEKGKTKGEYDHNENYTLTLSVPGAKNITLKFKSFCTEKDNDILRIFDGKDTFATLLGSWSGTKGPGTITSKDSFITIHFKSDKSVSCSGWEADIITVIIPPPTPKFTLASTVKCDAVDFVFNSDVSIPCDSLKVAYAKFTGPISRNITNIQAVGCSGGKTKQFKVTLNSPLNLNGTYNFEVVSFWKDFCDSVYRITSKFSFSVADCPLKVVLTADNDTICRGSCTWLRATVSGGNPSKYVYTWTPATISGAGPHKICPTSATKYILRVTDGTSIPSSDTVDIVVLDPPLAMADTSVCYYSANFFLRATPAGGKWYGKGIVNSNTGEFKPNGNYGTNKVWYQIGSCADTVLVTSTLPWNLENVMCPGSNPVPVWWFGPAGGTWSGPKITSAGLFTPDQTGTYKDTYTWKGCISVKTIYVQALTVKKYDTFCESRTLDTLKFSPYGIYPNWFPGLINSYYGTFDPSVTGPGNRLIVWNGGGCKDTTRLTILEGRAGPNDTFCPAAGLQILKNFRPASNYTWSGKGIVDPAKPDYDPSFFNSLGKPAYRDTLTLKAGKCISRKYVELIPTKINTKDTIFFCFEDPARLLSPALLGLVPAGGIWSGKGITGGNSFLASAAGYGAHLIIYTKNQCTDTLPVFVRPKPVVQSDTTVCISSGSFNCYKAETGGTFSGKGIVNAVNGTFTPAVAGKGTHTISYRNKFNCLSTFRITVDTLPPLSFTAPPSQLCFRDTLISLLSSPAGGNFSGNGVTGNYFNPKNAGFGSHTLTYSFSSGACKGQITAVFEVLDTIKITVSPESDSICPGEIVWLRSSAKGGDFTSYQFSWSNGQKGSGTFVNPSATQTFTLIVKDGCSEPASKNVTIFRHPKPWFDIKTSVPLCFGQTGWAKASMKDSDPYRFNWDATPSLTGDSVRLPAGTTIRLTATNLRTGCVSDTTIEIPGFKALTAGFIVNIQGGEKCLSNIFPTLRLFNNSTGATTGTWYWGDGTSEAFNPADNPKHTYNGEFNRYKIKLKVQNNGGCEDSTETWICFRDTVVFFIPEAFSPNGDGLNDEFRIVANGMTDYELIIYNRWGQIVFQSHNPLKGWDGKVNETDCPEGVYAIYLKYKGRKTPMQQTRSSLILMRDR